MGDKQAKKEKPKKAQRTNKVAFIASDYTKQKIKTQQQAADYVACDVRTIQRWMNDGKLSRDGDHFDQEEVEECRRKSRFLGGLYDFDIIAIRGAVRAIVKDIAALRSAGKQDLAEIEGRLAAIAAEGWEGDGVGEVDDDHAAKALRAIAAARAAIRRAETALKPKGPRNKGGGKRG